MLNRDVCSTNDFSLAGKLMSQNGAAMTILSAAAIVLAAAIAAVLQVEMHGQGREDCNPANARIAAIFANNSVSHEKLHIIKCL